MKELLFVKWHDDDLVGSPIVNEQHRGLVATINSLYYFMQQGWDLESLRPTILMLEQYVMFHLKTEESILVANGMSEDAIAEIHKYGEEFLKDLHQVVADAINNEEPNELVKYLAKWWNGHKAEFHSKLRKEFG